MCVSWRRRFLYKKEVVVNVGSSVLESLFSVWNQKYKVIEQTKPKDDDEWPGAIKPTRNIKNTENEFKYHLPPEIDIIISEINQESSIAKTIFRGSGSQFTGEEEIYWAKDVFSKSDNKNKVDGDKISLQLKNEKGEKGKEWKLFAYGCLRMTYISDWICSKLNIQLPGGVLSSEYYEFICRGDPIPQSITLLKVKQEMWKTTDSVQLFYKKNPSFSKRK